MPLRFIRVLAASSLFLLSACDQATWPGKSASGPAATQSVFKNTDITGLEYARDFALPDHNGKARTLADFKGKAVVIFFGYTQCPDVCPTTMMDLAHAMKLLGPLADRVQVLFVTLDPERDSAEFLARYVPAFDPSFLGLVGDKAAIAKVVAEFRVFYQKIPGKDPGSYSIDHTAASFVFDPTGRLRLLIRPGTAAEPIAEDLRTLLSQSAQI